MLMKRAVTCRADKPNMLGGIASTHKRPRPLRSTRRMAADGDKGRTAREPWDFGRFLKTVLYFNEPPNPGKVLSQLVKNVTGAGDSAAKPAASGVVEALPVSAAARPTSSGGVLPDGRAGVILVTGATGGLGKRVVERLVGQGAHVRALVRDRQKGRQLLSGLPAGPGGRLELVAADVAQRRTLVPEMFRDVAAVVSCTAVKVQPKEGDTPDREKYRQGIKFYDPEIVGDTPEAVELRGVQNVLEAVQDHVGVRDGKELLRGDGTGQPWGPLDDVVMGGVSVSGIAREARAGEGGGEPAMVFSGTVSVNNSGGFASVRSRNFEPALDLSAYEGVALRLLGDGQRYKAIIRADANWDGIAYCHSFDTQPDVWQTVQIPFSKFIPVFRAKTVRDGQPLDPRSVSSFQLMLSKFEYDGQLNPSFRAGPFRLPLQRIATYLPEPCAPRFVHVSSAGVTRPNRPGIDVNQEPPAVRMNDALGGILTYKLAGEDALRASGVPYVVVRPTALTEEPGGMPLQFDQGDTIKGKISRDDVADLCVALLRRPVARDVTFEVKSTVPFSQPWTGPEAGAAPCDWDAELARATLVPGVTGKTIDGKYSGKQPESAFVAERVAVNA